MARFTGCGHCGANRFFAGPRGGTCMNITCCGCSVQYNVLLSDELSGPATIIELNLDRHATEN